MIDIDQKQKIGDELNLRKPEMTCPICQNQRFVMADGYFISPLQDNFGALSFGGQSIPTIPIICTNCGFVSQHALGVLGLLPQAEGK